MATTYKKQALLTGVGSLFLDFMTQPETPTTAPTYAGKVFETPSVDKLSVTLEVAEKKVYLSNVLHTDLSAVKSATIVLDAGYLPENFAEEAQGMVKIGGGWSMPTNPTKKPFRLGIPITDENGDELILNFAKCTLSPVDINAETEREDVSEQIAQYNIIGQPLVYRVENGSMFVYHKLDLSIEANKTKYDRNKLLETGWIDSKTLETLVKSQVPGG